ncbi:transmembrane and coiled-coil domain-containing protein 4 isoform X2 [Rhinopithecus roxellana]|uniref:transmembrane and coiled-coil domain-containing protein 4 isoform X2 n=1 Tax=Rhinopithecus roxellana TaxID=61622 RepID=UPI0012371824|nr:transmembrane and coiled-coil domain-containing protein 4 isoform X2 [Rhinopithecus roxellana]
MATWNRPCQKLPQRPLVAEPTAGGEPHLPMGRELTEANRFAYAALCGISLSQLFPEPEHSSFCTEFMVGLVKWLELSEAVLPTMTAFASGLGGEGADVFVQILLKDPILKDDPTVIIQDLLSVSLKDGHYDARARVLVCHMTSLLQVPLEELDVLEKTFLESLKAIKEEESDRIPGGGACYRYRMFILGPRDSAPGSCVFNRMAEASRKKKENRRKWKRYFLIGLATVGGGTVIGVTGGLAAPLVAAGAATIIGSAGAAALGSAAGIAIMTSLFGAAGAGLTGYKMKKRVGAIEEFTFLPLTEGRQLHITIAITGWLASGKYRTFSAPWAALAHSREQYCLAWEAKYLMELGNALETILSGLANMVAQEALKYTVLSGIVAALTWPASLLSVANVIDNPWGVCLHRSAEVGKHLAHILLSRQQGRRPVTLIGFSLGARVIYFCLQEMAQEKDCQGIIEDVVLLGAPVEGEAKHWEPFRKVVSGRIINGYCRGDWLLSFVYRTSSVQLRVAGLQPVLLQDRRVENVDLTSVVSGHLDYAKQMDAILKSVGIRTKPGCDEKGLLLAPGCLPTEETCQAAAATSSGDIPHHVGQTQGPTSGDTSKLAMSTDPSQAQVQAGLDQSEGVSLSAAASPESTPICSHGTDPNPLGCPDCACKTQGPSPGLD